MSKTINTTRTLDIRPLTIFEIEFVTGGVREGGCIPRPTSKAFPKLL